MGMKDVRETLGASLKAALPKTWAIFPSGRTGTDEPTKPTLLLERNTVTRSGQALGFYGNTFTLFLIVPANQDENYLDDRLDELLEVLDDDVKTNWSDARQATFQDAYPCYTITLEAPSQRKY